MALHRFLILVHQTHPTETLNQFIVCSLIAWWILFHGLVPKIRFSDQISKIDSRHQEGFDYRIKFENYGKARIIDLEFYLYISILALSEHRKRTWELVHVKLRDPGNHAFFDPVSSGGLRRLIVMDLNNTSKFSSDIFPQEIRAKHNKNLLELEDVLNLGDEAYIQVCISGFHNWSGTRKMFQSKFYSLNDIKDGFFEPKSLEIKELTDQDLSEIK